MIANLQKRRAEAHDDGFTLVELLIVIIILGVLAGIVVFAVGGITDNSKTSACKSDKKVVEVAAEAFYAKEKHYPNDPAVENMQELVNANLMKSKPETGNGYTIALSDSGVVTPAVCP